MGVHAGAGPRPPRKVSFAAIAGRTLKRRFVRAPPRRRAGKVPKSLAHGVIVNPADLLASLRGGVQLTVAGVRARPAPANRLTLELASTLSAPAAGPSWPPMADGYAEPLPMPAPQPLSAASIACRRRRVSAANCFYRAAIAGRRRPPAVADATGRGGYTAYNPQTRWRPKATCFARYAGHALSLLPVERAGTISSARRSLRARCAGESGPASLADGTVMLGSKRYAAVNGDYRRSWRTMPPQRRSVRSGASAEQALPGPGTAHRSWPGIRTCAGASDAPRARGGGSSSSWRRKGPEEAGTSAIETASAPVRVHPGVEQQRLPRRGGGRASAAARHGGAGAGGGRPY